jgi:ActR/RegA family two-component response regulator
MAGYGDVPTSVKTMKARAIDFLTKLRAALGCSGAVPDRDREANK